MGHGTRVSSVRPFVGGRRTTRKRAPPPPASPLATNTPRLPRGRSVATESKSGGMRRSAAKMGRPLPLHSTPLLHFCPISHLQLLLSLCWLARVQACLLPACSCIARGDFAFKTTALPCSRPALPCSALLTASGCSLALTRVSPLPPPPSAGSERLA